MSTMRAATLSNIAGTGSPDITGGELSRARFNLNGTGTIAARDSFNVSSFTDGGAGIYSAAFSVAFPNADYSYTIQVSNTGSSTSSKVVTLRDDVSAPTSSSSGQTFIRETDAVVGVDATYVMCSFFGDKP